MKKAPPTTEERPRIGRAQNSRADDGLSQSERFIKAAQQLGTDDDPERFAERVRKLAKAPPNTSDAEPLPSSKNRRLASGSYRPFTVTYPSSPLSVFSALCSIGAFSSLV